MSEMDTQHPWIAILETKRAKADLMCWDFAVPIYCKIEWILMAKKNTISSAKLEWLTTQRQFGVSRVEECYLLLREGNNHYDPVLILNHPSPEAWVNDPRLAIENKKLEPN